MRLQKIISGILALFIVFQINAQTVDYDLQWKQIESLKEKGKYNEALKQTRSVFKMAQDENNSVQMIKATIHQFNYSQQFEEDAIVKAIHEIETLKQEAKGAERALLETALSDLYLFYYRNNSWEIDNRQDIEGTRPADMAYWTKKHFTTEIESLLESSLSQEKALKETSSEYWKEIFVNDSLGFEVFPTLYDFVAWKAIGFYQDYDFQNRAKEDLLVLNDPKLFGDLEQFLMIDLKDYKDDFFKVKILQLYQKLLKTHEGRKTYKPLMFTESKRLDFVNSNGLIDGKDSLVSMTVKKEFDKYKSREGSEFLAQKLLNIYKHSDEESDLRKASDLCKQMIKLNRNTKYFKYEMDQIHRPDLNLDMKNILLPNQAEFVKFSYKNMDEVWIKIVRVSFDDEFSRFKPSDFLQFPEIVNYHKTLEKEKQLSVKKALMELPPLTYGRYAIIVSNKKDFSDKESLLNALVFQVTQLDMIRLDVNNQFLVVERETGKPLENVTVDVYSSQYEYSSRKRVERHEKTLKSDKDGRIQINGVGENHIGLKLKKGQDEFHPSNTSINRKYREEKVRNQLNFFTDRGIYRPGQTVYFKGILIQKNKNKINTVPNETEEIKIKGANGKLIQTFNLTTNEFGSFHGSFSIPLNALNGNYKITSKLGTKYFRVEEYKRPKFEVSIEKPDKEYQLNDSIQIAGNTSYYSGVGLQNAQVKFNITRRVYNAWRYSYLPVVQELKISAGETTTNDKGSFSLAFKAIAPETKDNNFWFSYLINVEITDETGETHDDRIEVVVGKTAYDIYTLLPKVMDLKHPEDVLVYAKSPNGKKLYPEIRFKLEKIKAPKEYKKHIDTSDLNVLIPGEMLSKDYKNYRFSNNEENMEAIVLEKLLDTKIDSIIPQSLFRSLPVGKYKMTLNSTDKFGNEIFKTSVFHLFSSEESKLAEPDDFFSYFSKRYVEVGDTIQFSYGTSFKNPQFYLQMSQGKNILESRWVKNKKELQHLILPVKEEYRGSIGISVMMIKNNEFYVSRENFVIPYSNKEIETQLITFRNPMQTGTEENWKIQLKTKGGEKINSSEVLAGMYDVSLDEFAENKWEYWPYYIQVNRYRPDRIYTSPEYYQQRYPYERPEIISEPQKLQFGWMHFSHRVMPMHYDAMAKNGNMEMEALPGQSASMDVVTTAGGVFSDVDEVEDKDKDKDITRVMEQNDLNSEPDLKSELPTRKNLQETAFFYPQLNSDKQGNVEISFTSPEALTRWRLMVLAHTKDMKIGHLTQEVTTQKELMVMPNLPRFLRGGDEISISTKVLNLLEEDQNIKTRLEILDAATHEKLDLFIEGQADEQEISLHSKEQAKVNWLILVPEKAGAVIIRILAEGEQHSDGEEHILPVLSQLHFLTDTYPFAISTHSDIGADDLGIRMKDRQRDDELTLEIVSNPLWYVVQAIPNYQTPQKADALQWMNFFYIQSMAAHIVKENPEIESVFKQWQMLSPEELESELFRDPELKKVLIEETPWLLNAENQSLRKKEIARLFNENMLNLQLETALKKLQEMQKTNGGFGWMDGMKTSPWISARIASSLGQLLEAEILDPDKDFRSKNIIKKLVKYLDEELEIAYQKVIKEKKKYYSNQSYLLFARSYFLDLYPISKKEAYVYFLDKWKEKKHQKSLNEKMRLTGVLWKSGEKAEANELMESIQDIALTDDHGGIYWRDFQRYESVSSQAEMIELFELMDRDSKMIEGMKTWLLKQKRANDWGNNESTARACFAMLSGATKLSDSPKVYLNINGEEQIVDGNAGTGYFKTTFRGKEIEAMLEKLNIRKESEGMIFGAIYDQYFEKMSEIETHDGGVKIDKQLYVAKTEGNGQVLLPLSGINAASTGSAVKTDIELGDRILVRMTIENEQSMSFVHLRDYLPAGFENKNPLSGYRWQGSVSYYQSPGDIATDYFISYLPKGKFVIEYELNATISGKLNSGPAEIQSLYAPEFGGHSGGEMIGVIK